MGLQEWFESLRKWIDDEEDLDESGQPRPRSKWDDFLVAIAREVEQAMHREMFTPPGGPTYIPREYVVFLSPDDDAEWQGEKREGLQRGLYHVLSERAKELAGENEFQTRSFVVELRVDPSLEPGHFRVQHIWDSEAQKTMVKPRKRSSALVETSGLATVAEEREDEATIVRPRRPTEAAFSVEVRRDVLGGELSPPDVRPMYKDEISIGRGSRHVTVDLRLEGDLEVSRTHATLKKQGESDFTITCNGANPILVGSREIAKGESALVKRGERVVICSYELIIR